MSTETKPLTMSAQREAGYRKMASAQFYGPECRLLTELDAERAAHAEIQKQLAAAEKALDYNVERLGQTTSEYFGLSKRIVDLVSERNQLRKQLAQAQKDFADGVRHVIQCRELQCGICGRIEAALRAKPETSKSVEGEGQ